MKPMGNLWLTLTLSSRNPYTSRQEHWNHTSEGQREIQNDDFLVWLKRSRPVMRPLLRFVKWSCEKTLRLQPKEPVVLQQPTDKKTAVADESAELLRNTEWAMGDVPDVCVSRRLVSSVWVSILYHTRWLGGNSVRLPYRRWHHGLVILSWPTLTVLQQNQRLSIIKASKVLPLRLMFAVIWRQVILRSRKSQQLSATTLCCSQFAQPALMIYYRRAMLLERCVSWAKDRLLQIINSIYKNYHQDFRLSWYYFHLSLVTINYLCVSFHYLRLWR